MGLTKKQKAQQRAFYDKLAEALDDFGGFCELPPRDEWGRYEPFFHIVRQAHVARPEQNHKNWVCVYNMQAEYLVALPEWLSPDELMPLEQLHDILEKAKARITKKAHEMAAHYGAFEVHREQGRIFIRHVGPIPVANDSKNG